MPVTVLVVAKAPVPGAAKTRLAATIGPEAAADIAAAALLDTLDTVASVAVAARVVALTGDLTRAARADEIRHRLRDFTVIEQGGDSFADRLANAHADAFVAARHPVLQIGMDTPQVTAALIAGCAEALSGGQAVLGLAADGGWWVLGVPSPRHADALRAVAMSEPDTGAETLRALRDSGLDVTLVEELRDVDTVADARAVRAVCAPGSRFALAAAVV